MPKFEEQDVELSEIYKEKVKYFESFGNSMNTKFRKQTSDTIEAVLFFNSHKAIYLERTKKLSTIDRYNFIRNDLLESFPNTNKSRLRRLLLSNFILPFRILPWFFLLIFNIALCGVLSKLGVPQVLYTVACIMINISIGSTLRKW